MRPTVLSNRLGTVDLVIGLDGDDTLWRNEDHFRTAEDEFTRLMTRWAHGDFVHERLLDVERRNLRQFGYGAKGFILSMIETAIELSDGEIPAADIHRIVGTGKTLLDHPVQLLPHVAETVHRLSQRYRLVLVTKGDLLHQETKIAASGLAELFWRIEIVSEKDRATYSRVLERHAITPAQFVMAGNSLPSDVLPVVELGGRGVHIPYHTTWEMEQVAPEQLATVPYDTLGSIDELPALLSHPPGHIASPRRR